jgi:hypothetical protein
VITAETITDEQIRELQSLLPKNHWCEQWCADAVGSFHHPMRKRNARRECAKLYVEIRPFQIWDEDGFYTSTRTLAEAKELADAEFAVRGGSPIVYHSTKPRGRPDDSAAVYAARQVR